MTILQPLIDFYNNNEGLAIALISLASVILGILLPKLMSAMSFLLKGVTRKLGKFFGGRLAYRSIQEKYLDWVVFENQDLNLTGIIGTGQKPRLSQIFISLKILENKESESEQSNVPEFRSRFFVIPWKPLWNKFQASLRRDFQPFSLHKPATDSNVLFQAQYAWRIRRILDRDGMDTVLAVIMVVVFFNALPAFYLFYLQTSEFLAGVAICFIFSMLTALIYGAFWPPPYHKLQEPSFWFTVIMVIGLPIMTVSVYLKVYGFQVSTFLGAVIGIGIGIGIVTIDTQRSNKVGKKSGSDTRLEIGQLLSESNNVAILGKPGAGKSTYVQFIALILAQEKAGDKKFRQKGICRKWFSSKKWYFPILIPLRKVARYLVDADSNSVANLLFEAFKYEVLPSDVRDNFSDDFLQFMLKKKKCIFLLDGLDEVANDKEFRKVVNEIKGLVSQYPGNKFIITSRYSGWRGGVGSDFIETEVKDLTNEQINTFVQSWYHAVELNRVQPTKGKQSPKEIGLREQEANKKAENLTMTLRNTKSIRNLAKNPLLLSMICFVHYNKTLPRERLSLYEDCSKLLLEQWDVEKGLPQDDIPLSFKRKEIIMQEIAFAMHGGEIGSAGERKEATDEEIIPIIQRLLQNFGLGDKDAGEIFDKLVRRTGLIIVTENYRGLYTFSHLTFQEFYTAKYLHSNNLDVFEVIEITDHNDLTQLTKWWREVVLLYSSMQPDSSSIIERLIEMSTQDMQMRGLQMAAQCYLESVNAPNKQVENALLSQLYHVYCNEKISVPPSVWPHEVKHYLLRFSESREFREHTFLSIIEKADTDDEIAEIETLLLANILADDGEIRSAASVALVKLCKTYQTAEAIVTGQNLIEIITNADLELLQMILQVIVSRPENLSDHTLTQIYDISVKFLLENVATYFPSEIDPNVKEVLMICCNDKFQHVHPQYIQQIIDVLKKRNQYPRSFRYIYNFYNRDNLLHPRPLDYVAFYLDTYNVLLNVLLKLDEEGKQLHKLAIMEMLKKGSPNQQTWAIHYVNFLLKEDSRAVDVIIEKLHSPHLEVRISAMRFIRQIQPDPVQLEKLTRLLFKAYNQRNTLSAFGSQAIEIIAGKGALGTNEAERIHILGTLLYLDYQKFSMLLKQTLASTPYKEFFEHRYHWQLILEDLAQILHESDLQKFVEYSEEIADRIGSNLDVVATLVRIIPEDSVDLKERLTAILLDSPSGRALRLLRILNPSIQNNTEFCRKLIESLSDEDIDEATAAFEIVLSNGLI